MTRKQIDIICEEYNIQKEATVHLVLKAATFKDSIPDTTIVRNLFFII
jgi:hypothetical protein